VRTVQAVLAKGKYLDAQSIQQIRTEVIKKKKILDQGRQ
jgi:hypothetical protein